MPMAFRSGPVHASTQADVIAVHCSDPRYQPHFQQFLNTALGLGRYGLVAVPGGPQFLTLTDYLPKFSWAGWRWLKFLVDLANPSRIVLIAHDDCRWYHGFMRHGEAPALRQIDDLRRVRTMMQERFGQAAVEMYFARLEGDEAVFEEVR
jgi:hypothetical protein